MPNYYDKILEQVNAEQTALRTRGAELKRRNLETIHAEREATRLAQIESELAPHKQRLLRAWLADHPSLTAAEFDAKAWPQLRANLIDELKQQQLATELEAAKATGRYSL